MKKIKQEHKTEKVEKPNTKSKKINQKFYLSNYIIIGILTIATLLSFIFHNKIYGDESVFYKAISGNDIINIAFNKIPALIKTIEIFTIAYFLNLGIRFVLMKLMNKSQKGQTIVKLVCSFVKYAIALIAIFLILNAWGVNTTTLLASAGLLSLVIGLGAQSLIADIIAGIFIVFEKVYQVGDIIVVGDWRGVVDEIGIRTTKIIDAGGNVKIINNSEISSVINQTKELSLAKSTISIEYSESIERVELIIKNNLQRIKNAIPEIVEGPYYKGVDNLNSSSVDLLFFARCKEEDIYSVQRAMNRELKLIFDENNISIPFPQVTISQLEKENKKTLSKKAQNEASEFAEEQREQSKNLEYNKK